MYYLAIIFLFGAAYVYCLRFLPGQLTPIKKKHKEKVKTSWKSGLGFSPRFRSFEGGVRSEEGTKKSRHLGMAQSENNWQGMAR